MNPPTKHSSKAEVHKPWSGVPGAILVSETGKKYVIGHKLGAGGFADVYLVTYKNVQQYALKMLRMWAVLSEERAEIMHRFEREFQCSQIDSRYLVGTFDKGQHDGNPFFVMKYCPNGNLGDWIGEPLNEEDYTAVAIRVLNGLHDLHREGVIHRDLKPINILFDENNNALLTDFGISGYLRSRITVRNWLGHVKKIVGTVVYMPPEQLNAREAFLSLGPVTDMFAFGVMMHELICKGQLPFGPYHDDHEQEYLDKLVTGRYDVFKTTRKKMSPVWANIIENCIQPDPASRIQNPLEALKLLNAFNVRTAESWNRSAHNKLVLRIMQGEQHGRIYNLEDLRRSYKTNILTIGWLDSDHPDENHIEIKEVITKYISRHHATLEFDPDEEIWYLRDGQFRLKNKIPAWVPSTNGVLVNSLRITDDGFALRAGDVITIGDTTLRLDTL
jgi:serine/threonine protein kinase